MTLTLTLPLGNGPIPALQIELVGSRFLRRMVRILVATAVRNALNHGGFDGDGSEERQSEGLSQREREPVLRQIIMNGNRSYAGESVERVQICNVLWVSRSDVLSLAIDSRRTLSRRVDPGSKKDDRVHLTSPFYRIR